MPTIDCCFNTPPSNFLIIQGDWAGGLSCVASASKLKGARFSKVIFSAADYIYMLKKVPTVTFNAPINQFYDWLQEYINKNKIDGFILYNQYRPYNQIAWELAKKVGIPCYVFEQGLIRPHCFTIYSNKYNIFNYLHTCWDELLQREVPYNNTSIIPSSSKKISLPPLCKFVFFYIITCIFSPIFPHFQDQRSMSVKYHLRAAVISTLRFIARYSQRKWNEVFAKSLSKKYYIVPLQVHYDSQVTVLSSFKSIEEFILRVIHSFEVHAPKECFLVFKDHPLDRGYISYKKFIEKENKRIGGNRLIYVDRINLDIALQNARGCITINSTVGLSALIKYIPVITLGKAAYDLKQLTFSGELNAFWKDALSPDIKRVNDFLTLLIATLQGYGALSQQPLLQKKCTMVWPEKFKEFCL